MKTKIWISPTLELRHSVNGWPEKPIKKCLTELYQKTLAQAKSNSIPFENQRAIKAAILGYAILGPDNALDENFAACNKPDTFIEIDREVEVERICVKGSCMQMDGCYGDSMGEGCAARPFARLKPGNAPELHNIFKGIPADKYNQHYKGDAAGDSVHIVTGGQEVHVTPGANQTVIVHGLRARILEGFTQSWQTDGSRYPDPIVTLEITLDKLGIK